MLGRGPDLVGDVLAEGGVAVDPPAVVEGVPLAVPGARIEFGQKLVKTGQTGVTKAVVVEGAPLAVSACAHRSMRTTDLIDALCTCDLKDSRSIQFFSGRGGEEFVGRGEKEVVRVRACVRACVRARVRVKGNFALQFDSRSFCLVRGKEARVAGEGSSGEEASRAQRGQSEPQT